MATAVKSQLSAQYKHLCDDELLAVAAQQDTLTVDAQLALQVELAARNLCASDVAAFATALAAREPDTTEFDEYASRFRHCSREELLRIASEPLTLTPELRRALVAELEQRAIPFSANLRGDATLGSHQP